LRAFSTDVRSLSVGAVGMDVTVFSILRSSTLVDVSLTVGSGVSSSRAIASLWCDTRGVVVASSGADGITRVSSVGSGLSTVSLWTRTIVAARSVDTFDT